jgi:hypothetical protein
MQLPFLIMGTFLDEEWVQVETAAWKFWDEIGKESETEA